MKAVSLDEDDTLVIRLSDKPIVRQVSQDWRTHIGLAADGSAVEAVILEAWESGAWPLCVERRQAAQFRVSSLIVACAHGVGALRLAAGGVLLACGMLGHGRRTAAG
jgi:hypothetical protein